MPEQPVDPIAAMDQARAAMATMASNMALYYRSLLEAGDVPGDAAIALTIGMQTTMLQLVFSANDDEQD